MELAGARGSVVGGRRTTAEMEGVSAKARGKPWVAAVEERIPYGGLVDVKQGGGGDGGGVRQGVNCDMGHTFGGEGARRQERATRGGAETGSLSHDAQCNVGIYNINYGHAYSPRLLESGQGRLQ